MEAGLYTGELQLFACPWAPDTYRHLILCHLRVGLFRLSSAANGATWRMYLQRQTRAKHTGEGQLE